MDDDKLIIQWNNEEILPPELTDIRCAEPEHVLSNDAEIEDIEVNNIMTSFLKKMPMTSYESY